MSPLTGGESDYYARAQAKKRFEKTTRKAKNEDMRPPLDRSALVAAKDAKGWTQKQLAEEAGVNLGNLNDLINGKNKRPPRQSTVRKLAKALGVPEESLSKSDVAGPTLAVQCDPEEWQVISILRRLPPPIRRLLVLQVRLAESTADAKAVIGLERELARRAADSSVEESRG